MDPEKKSLNFIFPTKYVIRKSLKFSHWPSKLMKLSAHPPKAWPYSWFKLMVCCGTLLLHFLTCWGYLFTFTFHSYRGTQDGRIVHNDFERPSLISFQKRNTSLPVVTLLNLTDVQRCWKVNPAIFQPLTLCTVGGWPCWWHTLLNTHTTPIFPHYRQCMDKGMPVFPQCNHKRNVSKQVLP